MRHASSLALTVVLLAGCAAGSDFVAPVAPDLATYDATPAPTTTADGAQTLVAGQDIPAQWWELFHAPSLNSLIERGLKKNPDLASAEASLRVAQDNLAAGGAALFPSVSGKLSAQRQKISTASSGGFGLDTAYNLYNASVGVSYGVDLFGHTSRAIEGLQAQADQARFDREAVSLALTANIVTAAIQQASLRDQIHAHQAMIADQEKIVGIVAQRLANGAVAKGALTVQKGQLSTLRAALPPLEHQAAVTRHLLAALVGELPAQASREDFALGDLTLPAALPLSLPSKLVEARPDIREAQENLHAASAAIGVAEAARLPELTLSADLGSVANKLGSLFSPGGGIWNFGGNIAETIFDAGALADRADAARDAYTLATSQYQKIVINAYQNVADTLHALESDAEILVAQTEAEKAATETLSLTQAQFDAGAIDLATLLAAEQAEQQARKDLVQAQAARYADTAALFAALGGGWWNATQTPSLTSGDQIAAPVSTKGKT